MIILAILIGIFVAIGFTGTYIVLEDDSPEVISLDIFIGSTISFLTLMVLGFGDKEIPFLFPSGIATIIGTWVGISCNCWIYRQVNSED